MRTALLAMAEAFVNTFKRDFVRVTRFPTLEPPHGSITGWRITTLSTRIPV
jgi:hypothetical protein